jgi:hypothetical protein
MDLSLRFGSALDVLGFNIQDPLTVLIFQAELPIQFFQYRMNRIIEEYEHAGITIVREATQRIYLQELNNLIDITDLQIRRIISRTVRELGADVVIFDPFLPFFAGEENSNAEVRNTLDSIKYEIAQACDCAVFITDHLAKSDPGQGARARGAGAKVDWASLVINLSPHKTPEGESGRFIGADVTKMRYGWGPSEPFILRRSPHSLRHTIWEPSHGSYIDQISQIIIEEGGQVDSQRQMLRLIRDRLNVGDRLARRFLDSAIEQGVETDSGRNNSIIFRLPDHSDDDNGQNGDEDRGEGLSALM